jgi:hypothetical protein
MAVEATAVGGVNSSSIGVKLFLQDLDAGIVGRSNNGAPHRMGAGKGGRRPGTFAHGRGLAQSCGVARRQ